MAEAAVGSIPKKTREKKAVFGIGSGITEADAEMKGCRLPTNEQVIRCYMFYRQAGLSLMRSSRDNAKIVLKKVIPFYQKANIPTITEKRACEKIIELCEKNSKLRALPLDRRSSASAIHKLQQAEADLKKTFPLWIKDANKVMTNKDDIKFLESMMRDRIASFASLDKKLVLQLQRKDTRAQKQEERRRKFQESAAASSTAALPSSDESCADIDSPVKQPNKVPAMQTRTHRRQRRTGTDAFIPFDILKSPNIVSLSTRMKISPAQQSALTKAIIEVSGGDSSKVAASYATADRSRRKVNVGIAATIRKSWVPPRYASLHWDSKLMVNQTTHDLAERLVVSVGNNTSNKLLGVPAYQPGTDKRCGTIIASATVELLHSWECADTVVNMTFDTTASNTGHVSAACVSLQQSLGRALLWSACRHHVGEVILTQVFDDLHIEVSRSPEYTVFSKFKKQFNKIPHGSDEILSPFDSTPSYFSVAETLSNITQWKDSAIAVAITTAEHQREDYKEFSELCLLYLDRSERNFQFRRPGAVHKARWMSKILYSIKMVLLEKQIHLMHPGPIMPASQQKKLRSFTDFVCLIYINWWMTCRSAVDAPYNDLSLYQNLLKYTAISSDIAGSAVKALKRHLWYLCPEMVTLAIFSDGTPKPEIQYLVEKLLAVKPPDDLKLPQDRYGTGFGKPKFPDAITERTRLGDLVTGDSWFIVQLLEMDMDFLNDDIENWPGHPAFLISKEKTTCLNVVNDSAERSVKLSADFIEAAKSEEHYQNILQVVESHRKETPNLRKRKRSLTKVANDDD